MTDADIIELEALRRGYQAILDKNDGMCKIQAAGMKRLIALERMDAQRTILPLTKPHSDPGQHPMDLGLPWMAALNRLEIELRHGSLFDQETSNLLGKGRHLLCLWRVVMSSKGEATVLREVSILYHETSAVIPSAVHWEDSALVEVDCFLSKGTVQQAAMLRAINQAGNDLFAVKNKPKVAAADVMKLRRLTGAGLASCLRALEECDGDQGRAARWVKYQGIAVSREKFWALVNGTCPQWKNPHSRA